MSAEAALIIRDEQVLTAPEIKAQVQRIQEVMHAVMKEGTHYGVVPGTEKPSLYKPGAEKLGMTFHITVDSVIEADLSTPDVIRYRIRSTAHTRSGVLLGASLGECSSDEEKYKWRAAVCDEEFQETPEDRRRKKWKKGKKDPYSVQQVRTEPADIANTVLKMATKRAEVAVILKVTAASDCFTQDVEDLPAEVRDSVHGDETQPTKGETKASTGETARVSGETISEAQRRRAYGIAMGGGWTLEEYRACVKKFGFDRDNDITKAEYEKIIARLQQGPNPKEGSVPDGFK
jgi:hypothetical protein